MRVKLKNTYTAEVVEIYLTKNQLDSSYRQWVICEDNENDNEGQCHGMLAGFEIIEVDDDL